MKNNGFTLIELLAVIVILAIIALIAVPIVIHIINDSKKSSEKESIKLYMDYVQKAISKKQLEDTAFNPKKCTIQEKGTLLCNDVEVKVDMKGILPSYGIIMIQNNKIGYKNVLLNKKYYHQNLNGETSVTNNEIYTELISDIEPKGISLGDKYTYRVNDTDTFNFYVLSIEGDKVNLIMDRNICNDGTLSRKDKQCNYSAYNQVDNTHGPVTAMQALYNGTKNWTNVPDMIMDYQDENNSINSENGYTSIITDTNTKITTITGKPTTKTITIGTSEKPLKARLPKYIEVNEAGCTVTSNGSCPVWLVENIIYSNVNNDKYSINKNNGLTTIYGYRLLSSNPTNSTDSYTIREGGRIVSVNIAYASYGVRPVITVPLSDLSN